MPSPPAEVSIDAELIARLVDRQLPEYGGPVRIVGEGWDTVVARVGDRPAVRMPRRAAAVPALLAEGRWLPRLAPGFPVPVPAAVAAGVPSPDFPWPWLVVPWLEGTALDATLLAAPRSRASASLSDPDLDLARDLAGVHRALHRPAPPDAPRSGVRGVPLRDRADVVRARLRAAPGLADLEDILDDALDADPDAGPPRWLHGDPHPGNLLVTGTGSPRLAAVLDFGDLCAGDPATDLALAWTALGPGARAAYREELDPDAATWRRARGWAVVIASALASSSDEHPTHAGIALRTRDQLLAAS